ncbi:MULTISPECIES: A24 family peptidase [Oceanobacillus]|uniref:Type 4 prepilin-like proteins leader peptide-processing enzyme n=1 Tax=Oceanobacillus kimchii TaxID=746691 RepID=A0ABQ5TG31_9BACI|nr:MULTISPECIES: A24 family peptidase [Oceanobacillus]MBT2652789.1 prepilin peptidase [Oceanobacillus sp. ISL-73]MCT1577333.1 prepilin peptidase [Oceanobacillus kimchii]MCT2136939.1 prepilin peptidase [Oceanobacillus kimchii]OEH53538.1 prepilin peptidase [Oceanobacillus sp. E9]GLO64950.1 type 4 prepilin-like proteins leader peptide-processing enzyme [Oceanobacillus kimchii]
MYYIYPPLFFTLGAIFGSFFMVVGLRLPKQIPFANARSCCDHCHYQLRWYDNIPIISYIFLRGKCRNCNLGIHPLHIVVEIITGILFTASYYHIGIQWELFISLLLVSLLIIISITDFMYMVIPNKLLLFFLPTFIISRILLPLDPWWSMFAGAAIGFSIIFLIIIISKGGMGAGDMKLLGLAGLVLGYKNIILAFFLACVIGSVISIFLLSIHLIRRNKPFPFGPFIAVGIFISYFYGDSLINWYLQYLI